MQVNISGGNPLLVPVLTHKYITDRLKSVGVECKILFNPFNLNDASDV
jgi:hypothetical protein